VTKNGARSGGNERGGILIVYTELLKMIVGVLTTCHTQYT